MSAVVDLTCELVRRASVTPADAGCQELIAARLARVGFRLESLRYGTVWLLGPLRDTGLPDEPRPALEIQLALGAPFHRHVLMWNAEWQWGPAAHLAELLNRLAADGSRESTPPSAVRW